MLEDPRRLEIMERHHPNLRNPELIHLWQKYLDEIFAFDQNYFSEKLDEYLDNLKKNESK